MYWTAVIQTLPGRDKSMAFDPTRFVVDGSGSDAARDRAVKHIVKHFKRRPSEFEAGQPTPEVIWHIPTRQIGTRSMSTKQNGANATFAVSEPIGKSRRAKILSLHRTADTARTAIQSETRRIQRKDPGKWVMRIVVRVPAGTRVGEIVALDRAAPVGRKANGAAKPKTKTLKPFSVVGVLLENHEGYIVHVNASDGKEAAKIADKALAKDGWDEWSVAAAIPGHVDTDQGVYTVFVQP